VREVDGVAPANRDLRTALFDRSGKRGTYPQVFIEEADKSFTSVGDFDELQVAIAHVPPPGAAPFARRCSLVQGRGGFAPKEGHVQAVYA